MIQAVNISFFKIVILILGLLVVGNNLNQYLSLELETLELMEVDQKNDSGEESLELELSYNYNFLLSNYHCCIESFYHWYQFSIIQCDLSTETPPPN